VYDECPALEPKLVAWTDVLVDPSPPSQVPVDRPCEAFVERDAGLKPQQRPRLTRIRFALADVLILAGERCVGHKASAQRRRYSEQILDERSKLADFDGSGRGANVHDLVASGGLRDGAHDPVDDVRHVGEASSLATVAVDFHYLTVEQCLDERRLRSTPPTRVITWSIGPEQAQDRYADPVILSDAQRKVLAVEL
jgi:hypothetical protein